MKNIKVVNVSFYLNESSSYEQIVPFCSTDFKECGAGENFENHFSAQTHTQKKKCSKRNKKTKNESVALIIKVIIKAGPSKLQKQNKSLAYSYSFSYIDNMLVICKYIFQYVYCRMCMPLPPRNTLTWVNHTFIFSHSFCVIQCLCQESKNKF